MTERAPQGGGLQRRVRREAQRIEAQHRQLDQFHAVLEDALARSDLAGTQLALARFLEALEAHFSLEEEFYFPALHGHDARLQGALAELVRDHEAMREAFADVRSSLRRGELAPASAPLRAWLGRLGEHERREESLLAS